MTKISTPSPFPSPHGGEGWGEGRFGNPKLVLEICLGFGIWNLGFQANHVSPNRLCWSVIQNE